MPQAELVQRLAAGQSAGGNSIGLAARAAITERPLESGLEPVALLDLAVCKRRHSRWFGSPNRRLMKFGTAMFFVARSDRRTPTCAGGGTP